MVLSNHGGFYLALFTLVQSNSVYIGATSNELLMLSLMFTMLCHLYSVRERIIVIKMGRGSHELHLDLQSDFR